MNTETTLSLSYSFPENLYPPDRAYAEEYASRVQVGRLRAKASRVAICLLARELGKRLKELTIPAVYAIGGLFGRFEVFVFENDSTDGTTGRVVAWAREDSRVHVTCERFGTMRWPQIRDPKRGYQMSLYRNYYRDQVAANSVDFDYVIVLDSDIGQYSLDGICNSFGHDSWDAMGSNGIRQMRGRTVQFDAWAYRELPLAKPIPYPIVNAKLFRRGWPLVRLASCFGGLGIYTISAFCANRYDGGDCEHVPFHRGMRNVFLNPSQIVVYPVK